MKRALLRLATEFAIGYVLWTAVTFFCVISYANGHLPHLVNPSKSHWEEFLLDKLIFLPRHGENAVSPWIDGGIWAGALAFLAECVRAAVRALFGNGRRARLQ